MHQETLLDQWLLRLVLLKQFLYIFSFHQVEQDGSVFIKKISIHGSPKLDLDQLTKRKKCLLRNSALTLKPIISNAITRAARTMLRKYHERLEKYNN